MQTREIQLISMQLIFPQVVRVQITEKEIQILTLTQILKAVREITQIFQQQIFTQMMIHSTKT